MNLHDLTDEELDSLHHEKMKERDDLRRLLLEINKEKSRRSFSTLKSSSILIHAPGIKSQANLGNL